MHIASSLLVAFLLSRVGADQDECVFDQTDSSHRQRTAATCDPYDNVLNPEMCEADKITNPDLIRGYKLKFEGSRQDKDLNVTTFRWSFTVDSGSQPAVQNVAQVLFSLGTCAKIVSANPTPATYKPALSQRTCLKGIEFRQLVPRNTTQSFMMVVPGIVEEGTILWGMKLDQSPEHLIAETRGPACRCEPGQFDPYDDVVNPETCEADKITNPDLIRGYKLKFEGSRQDKDLDATTFTWSFTVDSESQPAVQDVAQVLFSLGKCAKIVSGNPVPATYEPALSQQTCLRGIEFRQLVPRNTTQSFTMVVPGIVEEGTILWGMKLDQSPEHLIAETIGPKCYCPPDRCQNCYKIMVDSFGVPYRADFETARCRCECEGGYLVRPRTLPELDTLEEFAINNGVPGGEPWGCWTGYCRTKVPFTKNVDNWHMIRAMRLKKSSFVDIYCNKTMNPVLWRPGFDGYGRPQPWDEEGRKKGMMNWDESCVAKKFVDEAFGLDDYDTRRMHYVICERCKCPHVY